MSNPRIYCQWLLKSKSLLVNSLNGWERVLIDLYKGVDCECCCCMCVFLLLWFNIWLGCLAPVCALFIGAPLAALDACHPLNETSFLLQLLFLHSSFLSNCTLYEGNVEGVELNFRILEKDNQRMCLWGCVRSTYL